MLALCQQAEAYQAGDEVDAFRLMRNIEKLNEKLVKKGLSPDLTGVMANTDFIDACEADPRYQ